MTERATYGGQAVVEGVMMRGLCHFAVACRRASGEIEVRTEPVPTIFTRYSWARLPFLRGVFALLDAVLLGMKSLLYSANLAAEDLSAEEEEARDRARAELDGGEPPLTTLLLGPLYLMLGVPNGAIGGLAVTGSAIAGMGIGIALFMLFPSVVAGWFRPLVGNGMALGVIEGVVRVIVVLTYIRSIGRMAAARRLFQYHGAEHKVINGYEAEGTVDVDTAERASRIHPRCGTNFVLTVLMVKGVVFVLIPFQADIFLRLGSRLLLLPLVGSISYEVIRLAGRYRDFKPLQWLVAPGLWTQELTTREPDRAMLEVAVASLRAVREVEAPESGATQPAAVIA